MADHPVDASGVTGRWSGTWQSDANGHSGGLRCILTEAEDGGYTARYHATYGWFFTFEYTMPMAVEADGDAWRFSADADLGWLAGGRYEYAGFVEGDAFESTYACERDHGTFTMERVRAEASPGEAGER